MTLMKKISKLFNKSKLNNKLIYIFLAAIIVFLVYFFISNINNSKQSNHLNQSNHSIENFTNDNADKNSHIAGSSCPMTNSYKEWKNILEPSKGVELYKQYGMLPELEVFKILSQDPAWNPITQKPLKVCKIRTGCSPKYKDGNQCNSEKNFVLKQCNESVGCGSNATCTEINKTKIAGVSPNIKQITKCICKEGYGIDKDSNSKGCIKCSINEKRSDFNSSLMQRFCI